MAINLKPKILLFDLGGVIVPWVGIESLATSNSISQADVSKRFASSDVFRAFERGQASEAEFLAEFPRVFEFPNEDITALWNSWVHPPFPGVSDALAKLKTRFTLGCLSNTNSLHWTHLNGIFNVDAAFDFPFASHHLQDAKPDAACYIKALKIMDAAPQDVWFFDDSQSNVDAARALGLTAFHVDKRVGVLPILRDLQLVS